MVKAYELLMRKFGLLDSPKIEVSPETTVYNPLGVRKGTIIVIDVLDLRDYHFVVNEIDEINQEISGKPYKMADLVLFARPIDGDEVVRKLRLIPCDESPYYRALLLRLHDEFAYDEDKDNFFRDPKGVVIRQEGEPEVLFRRCGQNKKKKKQLPPIKAKIKILRDQNNDGKIVADEIETIEIEYRDYVGVVETEGVETEEFLFYEQNTDDHWCQVLRGSFVDISNIEVL